MDAHFIGNPHEWIPAASTAKLERTGRRGGIGPGSHGTGVPLSGQSGSTASRTRNSAGGSSLELAGS
jgi:hypothetical protein